MFIPLQPRSELNNTLSPPSSSNITDLHSEWLGWVAKPNLPYGRGTFDILLSCLFTIFICTWTIQHPMVPTRDEKWYCMAFTVIAPEMLIGAAIGELWIATSSVKKNRQEIFPGWTVTHGFFALMGGFVVESGPNPTQFFRVNDEGIISLLRAGNSSLLPVPEAEINDRSKADILVKATACLQALGLMVQCFARAQQNLPITPLELATVRYAVCSLVIYAAWFYKPQQVNETITILEDHHMPRNDMAKTVYAGWMKRTRWTIDNEYQASIVDAFKLKGRLSTVQYFAGHHAYGMRISMAAGALFGSIYIAAWNYAFPSTVERILWRAAAIASTATPFALLVLLISRSLPYSDDARPRNKFDRIRDAVFGTNSTRTDKGEGASLTYFELANIIVYGSVRLYLLVAVFITFRSQPPEIYATVFWSKYIPHFT